MTNTAVLRLIVFLSLAVFSSARTAVSKDVVYDPLTVHPGMAMPASEKRPEPLELVVSDSGRKRELPIRVYLPAETTASAVVLFSHGLGGSREGGTYLGNHWAARGYVCVFLQHPGSDTSVWLGKPPTEIVGAAKGPQPRELPPSRAGCRGRARSASALE